jgi:hypothetical protein
MTHTFYVANEDQEMLQRAKDFANERGESLNKLIVEWIRKYADKGAVAAKNRRKRG